MRPGGTLSRRRSVMRRQQAAQAPCFRFSSNFGRRWSMKGCEGCSTSRRALFDNQLSRKVCATILAIDYVWSGRS